MKRKLWFVPLMLVVALCAGMLAACGPSVEDLIREDLTTQFDEIKANGEDFIAEIESSAGEDFATLGVDTGEFMTAYLDGFDYSIDDVTVEEDTATATVTVTCKSMSEVLSDWQTRFYAALENVDLETLSSEDELMQIGGSCLMESVQAVEPKSSVCSFVYNNDGEGNWSADESAATELSNAIM